MAPPQWLVDAAALSPLWYPLAACLVREFERAVFYGRSEATPAPAMYDRTNEAGEPRSLPKARKEKTMPVTVSQTTLAIINQAEHDAAAVASTIAEIAELTAQLKAAQEALPGLQVAAQKSALAALHATMNELGVPPSVVIQSLAPPAAPAVVAVQASAKPAA